MICQWSMRFGAVVGLRQGEGEMQTTSENTDLDSCVYYLGI